MCTPVSTTSGTPRPTGLRREAAHGCRAATSSGSSTRGRTGIGRASRPTGPRISTPAVATIARILGNPQGRPIHHASRFNPLRSKREAPPAQPTTGRRGRRLCPWTDDVPVIAESCRDPEITRWIDDIPAPYTRADARAYVAACRRGWKDGSLWAFAVTDAATGDVLGSCGVGWQDARTASPRSATGYAPRAATAASPLAPCGWRLPGPLRGTCCASSSARTSRTRPPNAWRRTPASSARASCARSVSAAASSAASTSSCTRGSRGSLSETANSLSMSADAAIERLTSGALSDATRRAYRSDLRGFARWLDQQGLGLDDVDAACSRVRGDARPGATQTACAGHDRPEARSRTGARAIHARPGRVPDVRLAPRRPRRLPHVDKPDDVDRELRSLEGEGPLPLRNRALGELVYSAGLRSKEAVGLDLADVDFEQEAVRVLGKASCLGEEAAHWLARYLRDSRPQLARGAENALFVSARPPSRHEHPAPGDPAPASPSACLRDASAGRRRRSPRHPELLGHSSLSTTQVYSHVDGRRLRRVYDRSHPRS